MLSDNQRRVLRAFRRHGILTLAELRKTSPYWNQAIKVLVHRELVKRENDGRYSVTHSGGAEIAEMEYRESPEGIAEMERQREWEARQEQQGKDMAAGNLNAWLGYPE